MSTMTDSTMNEIRQFSKSLKLAGLALQVANELGDDKAKSLAATECKSLIGKAEAFARRENIDTSFEPIY